MAASPYKDGVLSLGATAKLSELSRTEFINHLGSLGIEIVQADETTNHEIKEVSQRLASS